MTLYKIQKRNGSIETFDRSKIEHAICLAIRSLGSDDCSFVSGLVDDVVALLLDGLTFHRIVTVEEVQDSIEKVLMRSGYEDVARNYILYRQQRLMSRMDKDVVVAVGKTIDEYLQKLDWRVHANANQGYSLGGMILNTAGKVTANYWLSHVYPLEIGNAHRNADLHIHDLDMFSGYCAGWSLRQLLEEGFNGLDNRIQSAPPKNLQAAVNQMINFLGTLQNEWAGAQAFSSFDTYLAPYVHKYKEKKKRELLSLGVSFPDVASFEEYVYDDTYAYVYQQMQNFVFGMNVPSRWGTQTPFTNITLDWVCPSDLRDKSLLLGGVACGFYEKTFGELESEMRMINKALIAVYVDGDWKGTAFTFPIPTYNITEDFPRDDPDIDALFAMTAKYGLPYFQNFVGSQFRYEKDELGVLHKVCNPRAYKPGSVRSMCCRLQLDLTQLEMRGGGLFGSSEMTGSIGVVTLNLARIGYIYQGDMEAFLKRVGYLMDLAKTSLEIKRKELSKWLDAGLFPYTKRYLHSFRNHFSTIGLNGMNEAILNFTQGSLDISCTEGQHFAYRVLEFMREKLTSYQGDTGNLYNLEATPAEGTTYRFAKEDKSQHPDIIQAGTDDAPYYTNSSQLPVGYTDDPFEALALQNDLQCQYTGGTVMHLYMGERLSDAAACKLLVKKIVEHYQLPYITISPTFSICPKHGYIAGEHDYCPVCDKEIGYVGHEYDVDTRRIYTSDPEKLELLEQSLLSHIQCC